MKSNKEYEAISFKTFGFFEDELNTYLKKKIESFNDGKSENITNEDLLCLIRNILISLPSHMYLKMKQLFINSDIPDGVMKKLKDQIIDGLSKSFDKIDEL